MSSPYASLISGSDIRGGALPDFGEPSRELCSLAGRPGGAVTLTPDAAGAVAAGFARWLARRRGCDVSGLTFAVGRDTRLSGPALAGAAMDAFVSLGARVLDCSLASTPAMFHSVRECPCDGAVAVTASHHPADRNGLKFFISSGGLSAGELREMLDFASPPESEASARGFVEPFDIMARYAAGLRETIRREAGGDERPLAGLRIAVDAGGGVGGFFARDVLEPLGADTSGSRFLTPDGLFTGHIPNPENPDAMRSIIDAVKMSRADFGAIFDTDVDRAACVDADGTPVDRNRLIALTSAMVLEGRPGGVIVTDSVTSDGLTEFIETGLRGVHCRYRRGYQNVIREAERQNEEGHDCPLAIETSGHAALRENGFLDDGAYLIARLLALLIRQRAKGESLTALIGGLREPAEEAELRLKITESDFAAAGERALEAVRARARADGLILAPSGEGARVSFPGGFLLLRLSVHDPVMPLNMESGAAGGIRRMAEWLAPVLEPCGGLDISPLTAWTA